MASVRPTRTILAGLIASALLSGALPAPARADLRLCNTTESRVGISLGYRDATGWVTEGWWNLVARGCETLLRGDLASRFYYIYAVDYDRGGDWSGRSLMCTRDREFTIRGVEDCLARGFDRSGFFEIDTGEQKSWTVQLTDPARGPAPALPGTTPAPR
jgi:uncharacterized membrane protein